MLQLLLQLLLVLQLLLTATAIAAATAAATAAGASADAATAAATAATDAATAAITEAAAATAAGTAAGVTATANAAAIAAATAAATAAGVSADAATAAAEAATAAATAAIAEATAAATAAAEATTAATTAGTDAVAAAALAAAAATTAGEDATAAAAAAEAAATAAGASAVDAAALATAAAEAATAAATSAGTSATANATTLAAQAATLTALAAEVAAIQASLATVSTAAEVAALQAALDAVEADVDELMTASNVYQGAVEITTVNDLDSFNALGNKINIINGDVTITQNAAMNTTTLQTVVNRINIINGDLDFDGVADVDNPVFNNMTSVGALTIDLGHGAVSYPALVTAGAIDIDEQTTTADGVTTGDVTSVSFPVLTTVTSFDMGGENSISGDMTSIDINKLPNIGDTTSLTISTATGGTFAAAALRTVDSAGEETAMDLTVSNLASLSLANMNGYNGTLTVSDVPTVTVDGWGGEIDINDGVTSLTITDGYDVDVAGATDLVSASIDMTFDSDTTADLTANVDAEGDGLNSLSIPTALDELTTLTVSGNLLDLTVAGAAELTSVAVTATMRDLSVSDSDKVTSVDVGSAAMANITIDDNDDLVSFTADHTVNLAYSGSEDAETDVAFVVTDNGDMTSLTYSGSAVQTLTVTGNTELATVDFSGLTTVGEGTPAVTISGNDLQATSITESDSATTAGTIDDGDSGMSTLDAYLTAVEAVLLATATVVFDSALTVTDEEGAEVADGATITYDTGDGNDAYLRVLVKAEGEAGTAGSTAGTQATAFGVVGAGTLKFLLNGISLDFGTMTSSKATTVTDILASAAVDTAAAAGATVTAKRGYNSSSTVTVSLLTAGSTALYGERYNTTAEVTAAATATNIGIGAADEWTLKIGTESVTVSLAADSSDAQDLVNAWVDNWDGELTALSTDTTGEIDITVGASNIDSASYDLPITITMTDSTTASSANGDAIDYIIGATRLTTDNSTVDEGVLIIFTSTASGATNNTIVTLTDDASGATVVRNY